LTAGCAARFPTGDVEALVRDRSAAWITNGSTTYSVHGGYGTGCAHPGAHVNFAAGATRSVFAAADGVVARIEPCKNNGPNDKYEITLAIGMSGPVPVYFEYSLEPFGGIVCSGAGQPSAYFRSHYFVNEGQRVSKGDEIARFQAAGTGAHIHFNLKADGAVICPEIFPASAFTSAGTLESSTCGSDAIAANTFCHGLTPSEDPSGVFL
jgi:hypothetical protein